jgi:Polyglycine hydrolase-like, structural repeat
MDPLQLKFKLDTIHCGDEGDGPGDAEPYLWSVFFKIDGDTTAIKPVNGALHLQGNATVVGTPGNHGNLGVQEVDAGQTVSIPKAIGQFETALAPIPIAGTSLSVAGVAGVIAILMEADATPDDAVAAGHAALNKALADNLNKLIPTLGLEKQTVTDDDVKALQSKIVSAVTSAIAADINVWDAIGACFTGNCQDDQIGTAKFFFTHTQFDQSVGTPIPLKQHWANEGDWTLNGSISVTKRLYDAVWRPGTSGEFQFYGLKFADYQKHYDDLGKKNYRIHLLNTYVEAGHRLYDAVWRPGTSGEFQFYGLKFADYQKHYDDLWKKNYRIHLLNTYVEAGHRLYDAVWRPGTSGEFQFYGLKFADYQKHYDDLWKKNYRIYLLNTYEEAGQRLYDAVWRPGTSGEFQFYGLKFADYQKHYDDLWKKNYRIYLLNTYEEKGQLLYDAVWRPGTNGETQLYQLGYSDYQKQYDQLWKAGSRIELLNTYEVS